MSSVGSLGMGVSGSSEGWSTMPLATAVTKPWFEITVPLGTVGLTTMSNVRVTTLAAPADGSAGIEPGVGSPGGWISMPFTSGDRPVMSATGAPFMVVLPATYVVFTGTASRSDTFTAFSLPVFATVMV